MCKESGGSQWYRGVLLKEITNNELNIIYWIQCGMLTDDPNSSLTYDPRGFFFEIIRLANDKGL